MAAYSRFIYKLFSIHFDFHLYKFYLMRINGAMSKGKYYQDT